MNRIAIIFLLLFSVVTVTYGAQTEQPTCDIMNTHIIFQRDDFLYAVSPDGSDAHELSPVDRDRNALSAWSPDGSQIAVTHGNALYVMDADGGNSRTFSDVGRYPAWSPNQETIAYIDRSGSIALVDADGGNTRVLVQHPGGNSGFFSSITWSPDSSRLAYSHISPSFEGTIYIVDLESGTPQVLLADATAPEWSPEGSTILYNSAAQRLGLISADGADAPITDDIAGTSASYAAWSPDGSTIAYSDYPGLHIIGADGENSRLLVETIGSASDPSWAPDGSHIAFLDNFDDQSDIFVINVETGETTQVTDTPDILERGPQWQPCFDGEQVVDDSIQSTDVSEIQLIDIPAVQQLIMTLPDDWLVWRFADYSSAADAYDAITEIYANVGLTPSVSESDIGSLQFLALSTDSSYERPVNMTVAALPLNEVATGFGVAAQDLSAELILQGVGLTKIFTISVNDRDIVVGYNPQSPTLLNAITVFPEQELLGLVTQGVAAADRDQNLEFFTLLLTSLRPAGESLAVEDFNQFTGTELPPSIGLPASANSAAIETDPATSSQVTPEAPADPVACEISADQNGNLRSGPGTNFERAGVFAAGTTIQAVGQATGSDGFVWWRLTDDTWVRSDVVEETGDCDQLPVVSSE